MVKTISVHETDFAIIKIKGAKIKRATGLDQIIYDAISDLSEALWVNGLTLKSITLGKSGVDQQVDLG
jgi:hypothetical protein